MTWSRNQLTQIAGRRERLIARAAAQRTAIAGAFGELRTPIDIVGHVLDVVRFFRAHPVLLTAVVAATVAFRRSRLISLVTRGLAVWRLWRSLAAWSSDLRS